MLSKRLATVIVLLGLGAWLAAGNPGQSQDQAQPPAQQQEGMEVLTRGPIHEAFAEPVDFAPQPTKTVPRQPAEAVPEVPPDQKPADENAQWIPGYWAWDDERSDFIWISGVWRVPPPGRTWTPGYWNQTEAGWQWTPGYWALAEQNQVQYLPAPPAPLEAAPSVPAPAADSVMVPGTWTWVNTRYMWRPPYWVDYRPGWVWIPAHFVWTPAGFVFVDGYWDLELVKRGLLFSPIYFNRPLWTQASWFYRPFYPVYDSFLMGAMFVRPGYYHYYFGDFFDARYRNLGFTAWIDFRFGRFGYDPLFSYYRWRNRDNRAWLADMRFVYDGRFKGDFPRPPRTLAQQNTIIQNITVNNRTTVNNINITNLVRATAPLNRFESKTVALQPTPRAQIAEATKYSQEVRSVVRERTQLESQLVRRGAAGTTGRTAAPQTVNLALPKMGVVNTTATRLQPPPPPVNAHVTTQGGAAVGRKVEDTRIVPKTTVTPDVGRKTTVETHPTVTPELRRPTTTQPVRPETRTDTRQLEKEHKPIPQGPVEKRLPGQPQQELRSGNPPERRYEPVPQRRVETPPKSPPPKGPPPKEKEKDKPK